MISSRVSFPPCQFFVERTTDEYLLFLLLFVVIYCERMCTFNQEFLPAGVNHDWVRNMFSSCGEVVYVSLPKWRSTGDIKGFAFVEFATADAARAACLVCYDNSLSDCC